MCSCIKFDFILNTNECIMIIFICTFAYNRIFIRFTWTDKDNGKGWGNRSWWCGKFYGMSCVLLDFVHARVWCEGNISLRIWKFIGKWGIFLQLGLEGGLFGATILQRIFRSIILALPMVIYLKSFKKDTFDLKILQTLIFINFKLRRKAVGLRFRHERFWGIFM